MLAETSNSNTNNTSLAITSAGISLFRPMAFRTRIKSRPASGSNTWQGKLQLLISKDTLPDDGSERVKEEEAYGTDDQAIGLSIVHQGLQLTSPDGRRKE